jgi:hypothetical protein
MLLLCSCHAESLSALLQPFENASCAQSHLVAGIWIMIVSAVSRTAAANPYVAAAAEPVATCKDSTCCLLMSPVLLLPSLFPTRRITDRPRCRCWCMQTTASPLPLTSTDSTGSSSRSDGDKATHPKSRSQSSSSARTTCSVSRALLRPRVSARRLCQQTRSSSSPSSHASPSQAGPAQAGPAQASSPPQLGESHPLQCSRAAIAPLQHQCQRPQACHHQHQPLPR